MNENTKECIMVGCFVFVICFLIFSVKQCEMQKTEYRYEKEKLEIGNE